MVVEIEIRMVENTHLDLAQKERDGAALNLKALKADLRGFC